MRIFFLKFSIVLLKIPAAMLSILLIGLVVFRLPEKSSGLASFANTSNLFGSPSETQRSLDRIMGIGILIYLILCFILNIIINSN